jgi:tetratricopeptide (TPR) repeat protein
MGDCNMNMRPHNLKLIVSLFLIIITLAVFWQVRNHEFINYDDDDYVTKNSYVQAGWTWKGVSWAFKSRLHGHWHPVTWLSHMTDCQLFGLNPAGHHLTSLFLHIANALLLFLILRRTTGALFRSAFVAALFAIHPLHVEPVAWVAGRKDVLCTSFWMLAMWAYVRYSEQPGFGRYLLTLLAFMLGLMAKPMVVTLPLVFLLMDYWPLNRFQFGQASAEGKAQNLESHNPRYKSTSLRRLVGEKVLFFVVTGAFVLLTVLARQSYFFRARNIMEYGASQSPFLSSLMPAAHNLIRAPVSYMTYIGKLLWPFELAAPYSKPGMLLIWQVGAAGLLLICISLLVFWKGRRSPYLPVGWLWYLLTLLPVIGMTKAAPYVVADRYTYLPLIGLFIMIAWGIPDLLAGWRYRRLVLGMLTGMFVVGFAVSSWLQVRHWKNGLTLFEHVVSVTTNNWLAHNNLGTALEAEGRFGEAITHYSEAVRIEPNLVHVRNNLGAVLDRQGRFDEAISHFSEAVRIKPDYPEAHNNLGVVLTKQGKLQEAISHYLEALRIKPDHAEAHNNLGLAYIGQGRIEEAFRHFSDAIQIKPRYAEAHFNLGVALAKQGKVWWAIRHFSEAVRIKPDYAGAHFNLGVALAQQGRLDEAIGHFSEAIRIKPDFSEAMHYLKQALEEAGRLE